MAKKKSTTKKSTRSPTAKSSTEPEKWVVERVQTGVRLEKRLLKVLKALAEYLDMTLGDLLEGVFLHAFDGKLPFSPETQRTIAGIKKIYGLDLTSEASHRLSEPAGSSGSD